jgi:hypothetical protein
MSENHSLDIPQSPASERAYLAAIIAGNIGEGALFLDGKEFSQERHNIIYTACAKRLTADIPFDASLLIEDLASSGELAIVTEQYIEELEYAGKMVTSEVAEYHGRVIRQKAELLRFQKLTFEASKIDNNSTPEQLQEKFAQLFESIDDSKARLTVSRRVNLTSAAKLRAKLGSQKWLWQGYIPVGHVTLLVAQQGQGKSNVALDICHRMACGLAFPDGESAAIDWRPDDKILYLDAEGFMQGILSRLEAWGTPDANFIWPENCDEKRWVLNTPNGWAEFESIIAQFRPRLVVVDSLSGANNLEEKDNDQMKAIMQNLADLAKRFQIALIVIHHIRKASPGEPSYPVDLDRVRGASAITQFARVVLSVGTPDKQQEEVRRLDVIKNNLGSFSQALGFEITHAGLAWGDAPEKPRNDMRLADAEIFLARTLRNGALPSHEVKALADKEGVSSKTLERAKQNMNIQHFRNVSMSGIPVYYWQLPEQRT